MNENLNLVEILKDCPTGTKLYSTAFGDVYFYRISDNEEYPIGIAVAGNSGYRTLTYDGKLWRDYGGECILFPSKEQRDWSKFKSKQYRLAPISEFKDGDILATNSGLQVFILVREKNDEKGSCRVGYSSGLNNIFFGGEFKFARFATEEEKQKLFDAIKERGYEWNAETKTFKKLVKHKPKFKIGDKIVNRVNMYMGDLSHQDVISEITEDKYILKDGGYIHIKNQDIWELVNDKKQRFDTKTLQAFDKVLIRDSRYEDWRCDIFSHIHNRGDYHFRTITAYYAYCIPYNNETKHLLGTSDEAPEYYRYWED